MNIQLIAAADPPQQPQNQNREGVANFRCQVILHAMYITQCNVCSNRKIFEGKRRIQVGSPVPRRGVAERAYQILIDRRENRIC